jgi:hypothetical protein
LEKWDFDGQKGLSNHKGVIPTGKNRADAATSESGSLDPFKYCRGIGEGCILLVNAGRSKELIPCPKRVKLLTDRYGKELQDQIQVAPQALTANEANYLIGFRSLDEIRNRILKARKETNLRLRSKGIAS